MSKQSFLDLLKKAINPKPSGEGQKKPEPPSSAGYNEKQTHQDKTEDAGQKRSDRSHGQNA